MQTLDRADDLRIVSALTAEPFLQAGGVPPADEASLNLVEEALRNAIRELDIIVHFSKLYRADWFTRDSPVFLARDSRTAILPRGDRTNSLTSDRAEQLWQESNSADKLSMTSQQRAKEQKIRFEIQEIFDVNKGNEASLSSR